MEKYKCFTEIHSNQFKANPGPNGNEKRAYATISDWSKNF